jgi:arylsulfatase A-like enzyme
MIPVRYRAVGLLTRRRSRKKGMAPFRRVAIRLAGAALGLALALTSGSGCERPARPNLVLITIDTLRADRLACYGGPEHLGAAICRVGSQGTRFVWAFATAPYTAPSVASVLTSRYPSQHGVSQFSRNKLSDEAFTVAEALARAGYATAAFVSNPVLERRRNLGQGFDVYDAELPDRERNRPGYRERSAAATTDAALGWVRVARRPWFLWVHYQDPHGPYDPPSGGPTEDPPGAPTLPLLRDNSGWKGVPEYQAIPGLQSVAAYEGRYAEEIRYLDGHIQRLLGELDSLGQRPAVLVTADHGEAFGEDDFYFAHGHSVGLDQIRVPLLWRPIAPSPGRVVEDPVSLLDIAPTLLDTAGVADPASFEGRSLLSAPSSGLEVPPAQRPLFSQHQARLAVVLGRDYYARDILDFSREVPDPNSEGTLRPLPTRTASLGADGRPPEYRSATGDGPEKNLEPLLARFLARHPPLDARPRRILDPKLRERLRALGYIDAGQ